MKAFIRAVAVLILGIVILSLGRSAMASGNLGPRGGMNGNPMEQCSVFDEGILGKLNLTTEQMEAIQDLGPTGQESGKLREVMKAILEEGTADAELIADAQDEVAQDIVDEQKRASALYALLTDHQRDQVEAAMTRQTENGGRGGRHGGNGGPGQGGPGQGGPGQGGGFGQSPRQAGMRANPLVEKLSQELSLTSSQLRPVEEILQGEMIEPEVLMEKLGETRAVRQKLFQMAWTETPDMRLIGQTAETLAVERVEMMVDRFEIAGRIRAILSDQQQKRLDSLMGDRFGEELFQPPMPGGN